MEDVVVRGIVSGLKSLSSEQLPGHSEFLISGSRW